MIPPLIFISEAWRPHGIVYNNWDDVLNLFSELFTETNTCFKGTGIPFADCVTAKKLQKGLVELMYAVYQKEDNKWLAESICIRIVANKIPEAISAKLDGTDSEVDITEDVERKISARKLSK